MILVTQKKCINCGANIEISEDKETGKCLYCGSRYVMERPKAKQQANQGVAYFNNQPVYKKIPPRPKINGALLVFLLFIWFFPAIIYIAVQVNNQNEWDRRYGSYFNNQNGNPYYNHQNRNGGPFDGNHY